MLYHAKNFFLDLVTKGSGKFEAEVAADVRYYGADLLGSVQYFAPYEWMI